MATETSTEFEALLDFLKHSRGFDFTGYKRASLMRRIEKRMQTVGVEGFDRYLDHLQVYPDEFTNLFNGILINVTSFFRDPQMWTYLATAVVPKLVEARKGEVIRVWCAGCASGEEAYSAAMILAEALGREAFSQRVKIYGTDVDLEALTQARQALYTDKDMESVPAAMRKKYFRREGTHSAFDKDLRRALIFGRHDLVQDAPISRIDLLFCRNALMYFNAETQARVMTHLHYALNESGYIVLGKSEMLFTRLKFFAPVEQRHRVFARSPNPSQRDQAMMAPDGDGHATDQLLSHIQGREAAFESGPIPQLIVDRRGHLVLANASARSNFGLHPDDLGRPFQDLDVSYRPVELRAPIDEVQRTRRPVSLSDVTSISAAGEVHSDIEVAPLADGDGELLGVSVTFRDVTAYMELQLELERANQELETAMEELQSTNEELETTNEELQSTNEELETTNEELQSTNEELETMNEELQSTNEELRTLNDQVRLRSGEVNDLNAFLQSILRSSRAAVIVVDRNLTVTAWNNRAEDMWGLRADEVTGHPFLNLEIGLPVEKLKSSIRACLDKSVDVQETALDAINRRGRAIACSVTCAPLRGPSGEVQGAIMFMDATPKA